MASNQHNILNPILFVYFPKYSPITRTILEFLAYNYWYEKDNLICQIASQEAYIYPARYWKGIHSNHPFTITAGSDSLNLERHPFPFWDINLEDYYYYFEKQYFSLESSNLSNYYNDYIECINQYIKYKAITDQSEIIKKKENE